MAARADSCIKQCHPVTVEPLQTRSLVTIDRCRLGVCRGNNNLKGPLLLLSLFDFALSLSVSPSLLHFWALSVVLVNVLLSCLDVIYVTGCEVDLSFSSPLSHPPHLLRCLRGLSPSVSASLAPPAGTGRRGLVGEVWDENSFSDIHLLFKLWALSKSIYGNFCLFVCLFLKLYKNIF